MAIVSFIVQLEQLVVRKGGGGNMRSEIEGERVATLQMSWKNNTKYQKYFAYLSVCRPKKVMKSATSQHKNISTSVENAFNKKCDKVTNGVENQNDVKSASSVVFHYCWDHPAKFIKTFHSFEKSKHVLLWATVEVIPVMFSSAPCENRHVEEQIDTKEIGMTPIFFHAFGEKHPR